MKSIFKRYCLTYTYLSNYVKTSNEDKYKARSNELLWKMDTGMALPTRSGCDALWC